MSNTSKPLLRNAKPDTDAVASLVKNVSTKETIAPKVTAKLEVNEKQGTKGLPTPQGLSKEIHLGQQGKHIIGHNNYIPGRSPLAEGVDPQKLLNGVHSGEYPIIRMTPRNQPIVNFGKPIGKYEGQPTNYGIIHYGKNGAHIVPANPIQH
ncbi:polymorphic toxin type 50 domain-containing protein [Photorhabdus akhurstii]|uniref:polymorphic toxin type 50 domain-containing protein n=1 Tax=Photorhabdus akhurstii TaxID=171438 RepID=UPI0037041BD7